MDTSESYYYIIIIINMEKFFELDFEGKIGFLRKYSKNVIYNEEQMVYLGKMDLIEKIIFDINDISDLNNQRLYFKLYLLLINNILCNSDNQLNFFKHIIMNDIFIVFQDLSLKHINDKKVQKFLLSIIYNIFIFNSKLASQLRIEHFNYFIHVISSLEYHVDLKILREDEDFNHINDWLHVIFTHILINEDIHTKNIFDFLMGLESDNYLIIIELFRDVIESLKDTNKLKIDEYKLLKLLVKYELNHVFIKNFIIDMSNSKFANYQIYDYKNKDLNLVLIIHKFKELICLVDLISIFIIVPEYIDFMQNSFNLNLCDEYYNILKKSDPFYDDIFKRNKLLNYNDKSEINHFNTPTLFESNIMYSFQTNIMKLLSNYSYNNVKAKEYIISNPDVFYYFIQSSKIR